MDDSKHFIENAVCSVLFKSEGHWLFQSEISVTEEENDGCNEIFNRITFSMNKVFSLHKAIV